MANTNQFFDAENVVVGESRYLDSLARSFYQTGNEAMGNNLSDVAGNIRKNVETMRTVYMGEINRSVQVAEQHSGNILRAILAGAIREPETK